MIFAFIAHFMQCTQNPGSRSNQGFQDFLQLMQFLQQGRTKENEKRPLQMQEPLENRIKIRSEYYIYINNTQRGYLSALQKMKKLQKMLNPLILLGYYLQCRIALNAQKLHLISPWYPPAP